MSIIYITSSNLAAYIRTLTWDVAMGLDTDIDIAHYKTVTVIVPVKLQL